MGASIKSGGSGARKKRASRHAPMAEINVTPFVDVMLVLLVIFMVTAPLLVAGVPLELPDAEGQALATDNNKEPLTVSITSSGKVFLQETEVPLDDVPAKLLAIAKAGTQEQVFLRGDSKLNYGFVLRVMGRINAAGFKKVSLVTLDETPGEAAPSANAGGRGR